MGIFSFRISGEVELVPPIEICHKVMPDSKILKMPRGEAANPETVFPKAGGERASWGRMAGKWTGIVLAVGWFLVSWTASAAGEKQEFLAVEQIFPEVREAGSEKTAGDLRPVGQQDPVISGYRSPGFAQERIRRRETIYRPSSYRPTSSMGEEWPVAGESVAGAAGWGTPLEYYHPSWTWQLLPNDLLFPSYIAGFRESRFASAWLYDTEGSWVWDVALGGRVGIARFGTPDSEQGEGWQLDIEGAGFPRLNVDEQGDLDAADFRFGVPLTWSAGPYSAKFGYYHLSSHVGDEFLVRNPGFVRRNYSRDALVLAVARELLPDLRVYAEADWAFASDGGSDPWAFQFGAEYNPEVYAGTWGTPFGAVNGHLREEVDFGGGVNVILGWQWRSLMGRQRLRVGFQYYNGQSRQLQFFDRHEELVGVGLWYDY